MAELNSFTILGGVGFAGLIGGIMWFLGKLKGNSKNKYFKELTDEKIESNKKEVKELSKKQQIVVKQLEEAEKQSDDVKKKINDTFKKASQDVQKILKENEISKIQDEIDSDWDNI